MPLFSRNNPKFLDFDGHLGFIGTCKFPMVLNLIALNSTYPKAAWWMFTIF
jgi:hypothetical protein